MPLTRGHVLVMEDDAAMRALLRDVLEEEGYQATTAANGQQALDRLAGIAGLAAGGPDLGVLDHRMPVLDGPGFLAHRALPGPHAPVILNTSLPDLRIEGVACLQRPFDVRVFVALVRAQLKLDAL